MSKSGTWPGGVAMESLSNMDSAGSCDSVISMNSGYSDDSMEHLSAEERACLMYFEETIEALEVQEDSGLSNDEPEALSNAEKRGMDQSKVNDASSLVSSAPVQDTPVPAAASVAITVKTEQNTVNQASESAPASAANLDAPKTGDLLTQPKPTVARSAAGDIIQSSVEPTVVSNVVSGEECDAETLPSTEPCAGLCTEANEIALGIIPPPSDFMDEPDYSSHQEKVEDNPPPTEISGEPEATDSVLPPGDPSKKTSESLTEYPSTKPLPLLTADPPGVSEPRSPPAVAPKPKKLPSNIVFRSQKTAPAGAVGNSGHSVPPSSDRVMLDHQKVRMEALRKLGLLNDEDPSPSLSPKLPSKTRQSWAASSPPITPSPAHTPPMTPWYSPVSSPTFAHVPVQLTSPTTGLQSADSPAPPIQASDILPVPAAFQDPSNTELSAVKNIKDTTIKSPPLTPPPPAKLTRPKLNAKSASLDRSGFALNAYLNHQSSMEAGQSISNNQNPKQLFSNRPRPSSLGNRKDFLHAKGQDLQAGHTTSKEPDSQKPVSAQTGFQYSRESAKLPRSQGISVLICPRSEDGENRREALKKLGLLRD